MLSGHRRLMLVSLFAVTSAFGVARSLSRAQTPAARPPDIVLISIDSLRFDHLGCYGYAKSTSPRIDQIASRGVRFTTAVSTSSWTLPAHAALFTGLYDSTHGVVDNDLRLSAEHVTLAKALRDAGYRTAGFYGGPYLHPTFGLDQGFDHYQSCMTKLPDDLSGDAARAASRGQNGPAQDDVTGPRTVDEVTRWANGLGDKPFFLFVHMWDVHYDYVAPDVYVKAFDPDYHGPIDGRNLMRNPAINASMSEGDRRHLMALYDAEIRFTDDNIDRLLHALERRGGLSNTVIVITADHGEEFFEHGGKGHQRTLFDEVVRVPLIVTWPGHLEPRVVADQVRLIDVMPTLLSIAGVTRRPPMQGRDLGPLMTGGTLPPEAALSELLVDGRGMRALRTRALKVITQGPGLDDGGFDLSADPGELHPIPPSVARVSSALMDLTSTLAAARELRDRIARTPGSAEPDDETKKRLRSLGYAAGGDSESPP